jgi:hypothetical protein
MKKLTLIFGLMAGLLLFTSLDSSAQFGPRRLYRRGFVYVAPAPVIIAPIPPVVVARPFYGPRIMVRPYRYCRRW